eukprot:TRINITY_DN2627_c0_g1_i1.p1 TRINITY_DN2627_c0_g1~~TRINITY_DN2627_c0_g1_i1.p1  ORF type:complete len:354 (+),score=61.76 TRINITY_DN2627_c0_g1_i1:114-1175(+)
MDGAFQSVIVLSHGLDSPFGTINDMTYIDSKLRELDSFDLIINSTSNIGKTEEGIESCGLRLYEEILEVLSNQNPKYHFRLSIVAHSLGGLIARVCIKYLYQNESLWKRIQLVSYMSLSTPHLGVRRPNGWINKAMDFAARVYIRGRTMAELVMEDGSVTSPSIEEQPLLVRMSNPNGNYFCALKQFKHRTLFSIIKGDYQVPFCSASISSHNHYERGRRSSKEQAKVMGHSGFSDSKLSLFEQLPSNSFNPMEAIRDYLFGENQVTSVLYKMDAFGELEYLPQMIYNLNTLSWRRVDLEFSSHFAHDLLIKKATVPILSNAHHPGEFAVDKIIKLLIHDHEEMKSLEEKEQM